MGFPSYKEDIDRLIDEALVAYGLAPPADLLALVRQIIGDQVREIIRSERLNTQEALSRVKELEALNESAGNRRNDAEKRVNGLLAERKSLQQKLKTAEEEILLLRSKLASERLHVRQALGRYETIKGDADNSKCAQTELVIVRKKLASAEAEVAYLRPLAMKAFVDKK